MIRHSFPAVIEGNLTGTSCVTKPRFPVECLLNNPPVITSGILEIWDPMGSTAAACFFKSWTPRTTQVGSPDVSPSRCMVKAAVKSPVSPLRGKLLVLSLCVLLPTWLARSTSPFAAPRFRGTRLGQGRQGRQGRQTVRDWTGTSDVRDVEDVGDDRHVRSGTSGTSRTSGTLGT